MSNSNTLSFLAHAHGFKCDFSQSPKSDKWLNRSRTRDMCSILWYGLKYWRGQLVSDQHSWTSMYKTAQSDILVFNVSEFFFFFFKWQIILLILSYMNNTKCLDLVSGLVRSDQQKQWLITFHILELYDDKLIKHTYVLIPTLLNNIKSSWHDGFSINTIKR